MTDFQVEIMNEDNTWVHPENIRVSLRLVGQFIRVDMRYHERKMIVTRVKMTQTQCCSRPSFSQWLLAVINTLLCVFWSQYDISRWIPVVQPSIYYPPRQMMECTWLTQMSRTTNMRKRIKTQEIRPQAWKMKAKYTVIQKDTNWRHTIGGVSKDWNSIIEEVTFLIFMEILNNI